MLIEFYLGVWILFSALILRCLIYFWKQWLSWIILQHCRWKNLQQTELSPPLCQQESCCWELNWLSSSSTAKGTAAGELRIHLIFSAQAKMAESGDSFSLRLFHIQANRSTALGNVPLSTDHRKSSRFQPMCLGSAVCTSCRALAWHR